MLSLICCWVRFFGGSSTSPPIYCLCSIFAVCILSFEFTNPRMSNLIKSPVPVVWTLLCGLWRIKNPVFLIGGLCNRTARRAFSFHLADWGSISCTIYGPFKLYQELSLCAKSGVSSELCQVWPQKNIK